MNRANFLTALGLACFLSSTGWTQAQLQPGESFFQSAATFAPRGGVALPGVALPMIPAEVGKPFSAMAISRSEQTWVDGTHVTHTVTMMEYRDMEGRIREEPAEPPNPVKQITIRDRIANVVYRLNIAERTATKSSILPIVQTPLGTGRGGRGGSGGLPQLQNNLENLNQLRTAMQNLSRTAAKNPNETVEDLGITSLNGVLAHGTRTTVVVPAGAIGNDREFRSTEERWFSDELNLLIKSVSTDPRFGTTTYERKNISRETPDPSLFQVPAGYSIVSN